MVYDSVAPYYGARSFRDISGPLSIVLVMISLKNHQSAVMIQSAVISASYTTAL